MEQTAIVCCTFAFIGGVFALVAVAGVVGARIARRTTAEWTAYAQQRGLRLDGGHPMMALSGTMHGVAIALVHHRHVRRRSKGGRSVHYTHEIIAKPNAYLGDLALSREGFFASVGKVFGGQDIQVGDPAFDQAFVVRSTSEHATRQVLSPSLRHALLQARAQMPDVFVQDGAIRFIGQGHASLANLDGAFDVLARTAAAVGT